MFAIHLHPLRREAPQRLIGVSIFPIIELRPVRESRFSRADHREQREPGRQACKFLAMVERELAQEIGKLVRFELREMLRLGWPLKRV
jgi:hypothetical protein